MPIYNAERYLASAIESVLPQLGPEDELVIQDGGSQDSTLSILDTYCAGGRVRLESIADAGQADALGRAVSRATGDWVGWLNCDDLVAPGALARVRSAVSRDPMATLCYGDFQVVDSVGRVVRTLRPRDVSTIALIRKGCFIFSGATFVRRLALADVSFDHSLHYAMDYDLFLRLTEQSWFNAIYVPSVLGMFRYHDASKSGTNYFSFIRETYRIRKNSMARRHAKESIILPTAVHFLKTVSVRIRHTNLYGRLRGRTHAIGV